MKKKYIPAYIALALMQMSARAQSATDLLRRADELYQQKEYYAAARLYENFLLGNKNSKDARIAPFAASKIRKSKPTIANGGNVTWKLAESYRLSYHYKSAICWYEQAVALDVKAPLLQFNYGVALRANSQLDAAEKALLTFLKGHTQQDSIHLAANQELNNIRFARQQLSALTPSKVKAISIPDTVLTGAWALSRIGTSNNVSITSAILEAPFVNRVYQARLNENSLSDIRLLPLVSTPAMNDGTAAFSPDGRILFFTRWFNHQGKLSAAIYRSILQDNKWSQPEKLANTINEEGYNAMHPFVTADGKVLLFASDKPGGQGGFDIWMTQLDANGYPGKSENLGQAVNTNGNELSPFYLSSDKQLVFASNGRVGMGGMDLYKSKGDFRNWETPENMGAPVNSVKDDLFFTSTEGLPLLQQAWLSSDRDADCCLGLFSISTPPEIKQPPVPTVVEAPPPAPVILPVKQDSSLYVYFDFDKSVLRPDAKAKLDILAAMLQENAGMKISITGHTDGKGTNDYNSHLADIRAKACTQYLIATKGIDATRITTQSFGKTKLVATETTSKGKDNPAARELNRRVECIIHW
ncbi:outer membrane protein OmpA-like peptidoglycan-associated protein [Chitinophaga dinghuensis]|uniref:Outer membrane protein OmpA-like peptidoglycan-associated protein n=1 Tax=Chitinophaga dinghuensis TaxID=1539050 RepID=A0A327VSK8_9BACT|nr:OmpA family protein [Chitinophaga dinghuensis]RAJ77556.1 outer membrane protein OmpA-like peptidoglycan-associated protein [Chitinophaga dinghuensis]